MKTDLIRLNILCFVAALVCLAFLITNQTNTLPFLALIAVQMIAASIILRRGASKETHKKVRRAIIADNPGIAWRLIGLSIILPLVIALVCFYALGTGYDIALIVFLGSSYLLQIVVNLMLLPLIDRQVLSTFD